MLMPKKMKYRKRQKRRVKGDRIASSKTSLDFGAYGLKAVTESWVTARQIEAARRAITRYVKRGGKLWIRVFPDHPVTSHGAEAPMGKGKGAVEYYMTPVRPGTVLFEMDGITEEQAREALRLGAHKLPLKTKFIKRV